MWKDQNTDLKNKLDENSELLQSSMKVIDNLEKECNMWKTKSAKYKEIAARGHRMVEKRCSLIPNNPHNDLLLAQVISSSSIERDKIVQR